MTRSDLASPQGASADLATLIAIAIVAYATSDVLHEGVGHGGACLLTGGRPLVLSTVHFDCSADNRVVAAGGTIVNLLAGAVAGMLLRRTSRSQTLAYFLWLMMAVNLLQGGGYFLYSGVSGIGDWAAFINGLEPKWAWRAGLVIIGAALYTMFIWLAVKELTVFLGASTPERWKQARRLTLVPYLAGGILSCIAGLFNPVGMILVGISAAAASFGGASGLAWMWAFLRNPEFPKSTATFAPLGRSHGWIAAGAIVAIVFVGVLGPSLRL
jgi:hypothetical protein